MHVEQHTGIGLSISPLFACLQTVYNRATWLCNQLQSVQQPYSMIIIISNIFNKILQMLCNFCDPEHQSSSITPNLSKLQDNGPQRCATIQIIPITTIFA